MQQYMIKISLRLSFMTQFKAKNIKQCIFNSFSSIHTFCKSRNVLPTSLNLNNKHPISKILYYKFVLMIKLRCYEWLNVSHLSFCICCSIIIKFPYLSFNQQVLLSMQSIYNMQLKEEYNTRVMEKIILNSGIHKEYRCNQSRICS